MLVFESSRPQRLGQKWKFTTILKFNSLNKSTSMGQLKNQKQNSEKDGIQLLKLQGW